MVKRLLNALLTPHIKVGLKEPSRKSSLQLPQHPDTPIELKRTQRKKSVAFSVTNNRIKVLAPKRLALYRIQQLLHKRSEWIGKQLEYQATLPEIVPQQYVDGESIPYLGRRYPLNISPSTGRKRSIQLKAGKVEVTLPNTKKDPQEVIKSSLAKWYLQCAKEHLPPMVAQLAEKIGVDYGAIQIRHFKSRWGSCRADGRLQLNWRLMMAPSDVIEYVIIHELCHRIHLNHSPAFWREVERHMPQFRQHRQWLKAEGHRLTL